MEKWETNVIYFLINKSKFLFFYMSCCLCAELSRCSVVMVLSCPGVELSGCRVVQHPIRKWFGLRSAMIPQKTQIEKLKFSLVFPINFILFFPELGGDYLPKR